jgi:hypothetical protein
VVSDLTAMQRAELERMQRDGVEATLERWKRERKAETAACPHHVVTYRADELSACRDCDSKQVGAIWADPEDGELSAKMGNGW